MKRINNILTVAVLAVIATFYSCNSDDEIISEELLENLTRLTEKQIPETDLSVKIYQYTESLSVGYNRFEILVSKMGVDGAFTDAQITFKPMMDMGDMMHACPIENPVLGTNFDNVFAGALVFVMPSGDMGNWTLGVKVKDNETEEEGEVMLPIHIELPDESRMKSFSMGDDKYFISLIEPFIPQVGINDFEVTVHKKQSMMEWPSVEDFNIAIEPEMPDMGHGSPNNVDPIHASNGHYFGKVNFTMDGYWKINVELEKDGLRHEMSFDITFEHKSTN